MSRETVALRDAANAAVHAGYDSGSGGSDYKPLELKTIGGTGGPSIKFENPFMAALGKAIANAVNTAAGSGTIPAATPARASHGEMRAEAKAPTPKYVPEAYGMAKNKQQAEQEYKAANADYEERTSELNKLLAKTGDYAGYGAELEAAKTAAADSKAKMEDAAEIYKAFGGTIELDNNARLGKTIAGGGEQYLADLLGTAGAAYEGGVRGSKAQIERELADMATQEERAQKAYDDALAKYNGDTNNANVQAAARALKEVQDNRQLYQGMLENTSLEETAAKIYGASDRMAERGAQDIARAKEGLGETGQFLVDTGVAGTQLGLDILLGQIPGLSMMGVMGTRSFGGGANEARRAGATYEQQFGTGAATAAVEMLTEKLADGLAGVAGKGAADDAAKEIIRKWAKTDAGRTALRAVYGISGEAGEEAISTLVSPLIDRIYNADALKESYGTAEGRKALLSEALHDALVGGALGGLGSVGSIATGQNAAELADMRAADANLGDVQSQVNNAFDVLSGRMTPEQSQARAAAAMEALGVNAQPAAPAVAEAPAPQAQERPAPNMQDMLLEAAGVTPAAEAAPAAAPVVEQAPVEAASAQSLDERMAQIQERYDAIEAELDDPNVDEARVNELIAEGEALYTERANLEQQIEARNTQQQRVNDGAVSKQFGEADNHIDNRTNENVAAQGVKAFQYDHPELHGHFVQAAQALADLVQSAQTVDTSVRNRKTTSKYYENKRNRYANVVRALTDLGLTKPRILQCCQDIINNNGAENYADAKRVELALNDMLTNGYTALNGELVGPNADYIAAKDAINGAKTKPASGSWEDYLARNELALATGEVTEEQLRAEWEAQQPAEPTPPANGLQDYLLKEHHGNILDNVRQHLSEISDMESVSDLSGNEFQKSESDQRPLRQKVIDFFNRLGNKVHREGFGDIELNDAGARDSTAHGYGKLKAATFASLPAVLENGKLISHDPRFQGRNYESFLIAAPVTVAGERCYVGALVIKDSNTQRYKLHEVLTINKDGTQSFKSETSKMDGDSAAGIPSMGDTSPTANVAQPAPVVNGENVGPTTAETTDGTGPLRERGGSANIRTNENAEAALRQSFEESPETYRQMTNAETQEKADAILAKGFDAARSEVEQAIGRAKAGYKLSPEHLVAGFDVANELTRRGETEAANRLMADIFAEQTAAGQLGQLGRLLRQSSPAVKSLTVENIVNKINDKLTKGQIRKNLRRGQGDAEGRIVVDPQLLDNFTNAETDEASNAALDAIEQNIADQIPATFRDKFTALRYLNMLGNLKTQGRNLIGNTAMMAATNAKYNLQAGIELLASAVSGGKYERNTSLMTSSQLRQQAAADFAENVDDIKGEGKYSDVSKQATRDIEDKRTIFDFKPLERYRKRTKWAMEAGDVVFMKPVYVRSFAGWMQAHGVTDVANATPEQIAKARAFATKEAQEATFHDSNAVSDWVSGLGRGENTPDFVKAISEGVMPFRKTPANVAVRAIEYSPVGVAETIYKGVQAAKGQATTADVINSLSKNVTGTSLLVAGYFLAAAGMARGSNDDDEKLSAFQKLQGAMDYSVKIGDRNISLSQLAPMAIPFFMGVKLNELIERSDEPLSLDDAKDILGIVTDPMLEMSMLSGVNDFLNDLSSLNGDTDAIPSLVANAAINYLSQGLTNTLLGQFEQASEENRQTTYTDTKSDEATDFDKRLGSEFQRKLAGIAAKIPGIDYHQQDYVDAWGRTQSTGTAAERYFNALLNPTYTSEDNSTEVDAELERLYTENKGIEGFPDVLPKRRGRSATYDMGKVMTPDEYLQYSKDSGQMKLELVKDFMGSEQYAGLSDQERADVISKLYSFADDRAVQKVKDSHGITTTSDWQTLIEGVDKPGELNDIPALDQKNAGEYIYFTTLYNEAKKNGDYGRLDSLLTEFPSMAQNTQDVIGAKKLTDMKNLQAFMDAGSGAETFYTIKDAVGDAQMAMDATSATGSHVRLAGLGSVDIPDEEKDRLVESGAFKLSGTAKSAYEILRDYGYSPQQASDFFENADWYASGSDKEAGADGRLNAYEVATAISKIPGLTAHEQDALYQAFKAAIQNPKDAYDTWKKKSYTQALRQSTNYGRTTGKPEGLGDNFLAQAAGLG